MTRRADAVLIAMVVVQLVHAVEEFVFEFWNRFPPMRAVYGDAPGLGPAVFVLFHAVLVGFGVWCWAQVRRGGLKAWEAIAAWVVIQGTTLAVHLAWFVVDPSYQPGLATAPLFLATIAAAITVSRRERVTGRGSGN